MVAAEILQSSSTVTVCRYKCSKCIIGYCIEGHSNLVVHISTLSRVFVALKHLFFFFKVKKQTNKKTNEAKNNT